MMLPIVPFAQIPQTPTWIIGQTLGMVPFRILIVWLYNNIGKCIFSAIIFHAMSNVSQFVFPNYGSYYDPFFTWIILVFTASIIISIWGSETLARYRYSKSTHDISFNWIYKKL
jgi:uncharacterized protein